MTTMFTDRYQALGIPYPDPKTMCRGQCEGTGWIPVNFDEADATLHRLWAEAHRKTCWLSFRRFFLRCDGWHFVKCPDCDGTGKAK